MIGPVRHPKTVTLLFCRKNQLIFVKLGQSACKIQKNASTVSPNKVFFRNFQIGESLIAPVTLERNPQS